MLNQVYQKLETIERFRSTPEIGPHLDKITTTLLDLGYQVCSVRDYIRASAKFGTFLFMRGVPLRELDEIQVEAFLKNLESQYGNDAQAIRAQGKYRPPLMFLLEFLRREGAVRPKQELPMVTSCASKTLDEYLTFLQTHRGLNESTIDQRKLHVGRFLDQISGQPLETIKVQQIDQFLLNCATTRSRRSMGCVSTAIRDFVRYLHLMGKLPLDFSQQVASPRRYRFETIPRSISWQEINAMLVSVDQTTAIGRRDYAILMLLVVYGIRASEVAALTIDDFDWLQNMLTVQRSKGGEKCEFPLHTEVGNAVINYLKDGRPASSDRHVFFATSPPLRPLNKGSISGLVRRYLKRAGIQAPHWGSHTVRHYAVFPGMPSHSAKSDQPVVFSTERLIGKTPRPRC